MKDSVIEADPDGSAGTALAALEESGMEPIGDHAALDVQAGGGQADGEEAIAAGLV
jgi:hypothetical protein